MKKLLTIALSFLVAFTILDSKIVSAKEGEGLSNINIIEKYNDDPFIKEYEVSDGIEKHIITINKITNILKIDGEEFKPITVGMMSRSSVDYSTAQNLTYNIPWRGSLAMVGVLVATLPGVGATIAGAIIAAVTTEGDELVVTCTKYQSKEQYYSEYHGSYYRKGITKNIKVYSGGSLIYGPVDGDWFDPIRPF